jgi:hypothetical protein
MNNIDWINSVVGKPWQDRANGPNSFDCWGLVEDYFLRVRKSALSEVAGYANGEPIEAIGAAEAQGWPEAENHSDGVVFCIYTEAGDMIHVGAILDIYKAGYYAVHAAGKNGRGQVIAEPIQQPITKYTRLKCTIKYYKQAQ